MNVARRKSQLLLGFITLLGVCFLIPHNSIWARGSGMGGGPSFKWALSSLPKKLNDNINNAYADTTPPAFSEDIMLFNGGEGYMMERGVSFGGSGWSGSLEQTVNGNKVSYRLSYGGFSFGYEVISTMYFGLNLSNMIGFGSYEYNRYNNITSTSTTATYFHVRGDLFLFEPSITMRLNLTPFFGLGFGGSYLWATHTSLVQEGNGPDNELLPTSSLTKIVPSHAAFRLVIFLGKF